MTIIVLSWIKSPLPFLPPSIAVPLIPDSISTREHGRKREEARRLVAASNIRSPILPPSLSLSLVSHVSNLLRSTPKMLFETNDGNGGENARISYLVLQFPFRRCRM